MLGFIIFCVVVWLLCKTKVGKFLLGLGVVVIIGIICVGIFLGGLHFGNVGMYSLVEWSTSLMSPGKLLLLICAVVFIPALIHCGKEVLKEEKEKNK